MDSSQDYRLLFGYENKTHTVLGFSRRYDTCDPRDLKITVSNRLLSVIAAKTIRPWWIFACPSTLNQVNRLKMKTLSVVLSIFTLLYLNVHKLTGNDRLTAPPAPRPPAFYSRIDSFTPSRVYSFISWYDKRKNHLPLRLLLLFFLLFIGRARSDWIMDRRKSSSISRSSLKLLESNDQFSRIMLFIRSSVIPRVIIVDRERCLIHQAVLNNALK